MENQQSQGQAMKFCKFCGAQIAASAVICPQCGSQVEEFKRSEQPQIVINNANTNTNTNANVNGGMVVMGRMRSKWTAFFLCFFLGFVGAHKFYEGKTGMGILYLFTIGLFGIGWFIDTIALLFKPNPYYV